MIMYPSVLIHKMPYKVTFLTISRFDVKYFEKNARNCDETRWKSTEVTTRIVEWSLFRFILSWKVISAEK